MGIILELTLLLLTTDVDYQSFVVIDVPAYEMVQDMPTTFWNKQYIDFSDHDYKTETIYR